jgi:cytochrome c biogenesis protein CcmG, thiol:disulfide interchange protein DsbE
MRPTRRTVLTFLAGGLAILGSGPAARASARIGQPAPPFAALTLGGDPFDLGKLRGKVVLVNFWATWCSPCREEMPVLDAFYRRYHSDGLEMIGVSVDVAANRRQVLGVVRSLNYPAATIDEVLVNGFGRPEAVPITYVIDAGGMVNNQFFAAPKGMLERMVLPLLRKAAPGRENPPGGSVTNL